MAALSQRSVDPRFLVVPTSLSPLRKGRAQRSARRERTKETSQIRLTERTGFRFVRSVGVGSSRDGLESNGFC
jgi:hypothetical protein